MTPEVKAALRPGPATKAVAKYHAVVSARVERSRLALQPVGRDALHKALQAAPAYWPHAERYPGLALGTTSDHLRCLVLWKLTALFDFDAKLGGDTGAEIRDRVYAEFPAARAALERRGVNASTRYLRIPVIARLRSDGEAEWGATLPPLAAGVMPAGSREAFQREIDGRPAWEVYLQNLVRASIYDDLENCRSSLGI